MWLPRIGFGYQLNSKTVIRGGYGVYYDTLDVNTLVYGPNQSGLQQQHQHHIHHHARRYLGHQRSLRQLVQRGDDADFSAYRPVPGAPHQRQHALQRAGRQYLRSDGPAGDQQRAEQLDRAGQRASPHATLARKHRAATHRPRRAFVCYTGAWTSKLNINVNQSAFPASYYYQGASRPVNAAALRSRALPASPTRPPRLPGGHQLRQLTFPIRSTSAT